MFQSVKNSCFSLFPRRDPLRLEFNYNNPETNCHCKSHFNCPLLQSRSDNVAFYIFFLSRNLERCTVLFPKPEVHSRERVSFIQVTLYPIIQNSGIAPRKRYERKLGYAVSGRGSGKHITVKIHP